MMRAVRILRLALEEAAEAAAWYEEQRTGLGRDFQLEAEAALDILEGEIPPLTPVSGALGRRGVKRLLLSRFPYSLIVRESGAEIVVIALAHHAREPGYWKNRMPSE